MKSIACPLRVCYIWHSKCFIQITVTFNQSAEWRAGLSQSYAHTHFSFYRTVRLCRMISFEVRTCLYNNMMRFFPKIYHHRMFPSIKISNPMISNPWLHSMEQPFFDQCLTLSRWNRFDLWCIKNLWGVSGTVSKHVHERCWDWYFLSLLLAKLDDENRSYTFNEKPHTFAMKEHAKGS